MFLDFLDVRLKISVVSTHVKSECAREKQENGKSISTLVLINSTQLINEENLRKKK